METNWKQKHFTRSENFKFGFFLKKNPEATGIIKLSSRQTDSVDEGCKLLSIFGL